MRRAPCAVSIYLPTSRIAQEAHTNRVELINLASIATDQLHESKPHLE